MDLKNLPARYTKISNEMDKDIAVQANTADSKPTIQDIKQEASRPGFLTWKADDEPFFRMKGKAKITGQNFDLDAALQGKHQVADKQGKSTQEFPNVKPLVVKAEAQDNDDDDDDDDDKSKALGQWDLSGNLGKLLALGLVFGLGFYVGRKYKI